MYRHRYIRSVGLEGGNGSHSSSTGGRQNTGNGKEGGGTKRGTSNTVLIVTWGSAGDGNPGKGGFGFKYRTLNESGVNGVDDVLEKLMIVPYTSYTLPAQPELSNFYNDYTYSEVPDRYGNMMQVSVISKTAQQKYNEEMTVWNTTVYKFSYIPFVFWNEPFQINGVTDYFKFVSKNNNMNIDNDKTNSYTGGFLIIYKTNE